MDNVRLDCRTLAQGLWRLPEGRVHVGAVRLRRGYQKGRPWSASATAFAADHLRDRDRHLEADGATEHGALAALREKLLSALTAEGARLYELAGRYDRMAGDARQTAHDVAALVAATRRAMAMADAAEGADA